MTFKYAEVFSRIESTVRNRSKHPNNYDRFKHYAKRNLTDNDYFMILVDIIFYSGFRAETVTQKIDLIHGYFPDYRTVSGFGESEKQGILSDRKMIRNERKISAVVENAKELVRIVDAFGSFAAYVESFEANTSFENLMLLKEELEYRFAFLGGITSYHFLTEIGLPVLKPDRVITRLFWRLGLIEDERQLLKSVIHGKKFAEATGLPIRYIDIILVKYGQMGSDDDFGLEDGICLLKNPKCSECSVQSFCRRS